MGCLQVITFRVVSGIEPSSQRVGELLSPSAQRADEPILIRSERASERMTVYVSRIEDLAKALARRMGATLRVNCGLVCSVDHADYLKIEPQYLWLMKDNDFSGEVLIWSNVQWQVS